MCICLYTKYIVLADPPVHSKAVCNKSTIALPKQSLKVFSGNTAAVTLECVPKLGNCLEMYTCAQAVPKHVYTSRSGQAVLVAPVYKECPSLNTHCAQIGHWLGHMCTFPSSFKLGHSNFYSSAHVAHISSLKWCYRSNKLHASYILPLGWSCKLMLYTRLLCNSPGEGKRKETILKHI